MFIVLWWCSDALHLLKRLKSRSPNACSPVKLVSLKCCSCFLVSSSWTPWHFFSRLLEESLLVASLLFPGSPCTTYWGCVSPPLWFPVGSSALPWRWVHWPWTRFQRGVRTDQQKHPLHYLSTSAGNHASSPHEYRSPGSGHPGQEAPNKDLSPCRRGDQGQSTGSQFRQTCCLLVCSQVFCWFSGVTASSRYILPVKMKCSCCLEVVIKPVVSKRGYGRLSVIVMKATHSSWQPCFHHHKGQSSRMQGVCTWKHTKRLCYNRQPCISWLIILLVRSWIVNWKTGHTKPKSNQQENHY